MKRKVSVICIICVMLLCVVSCAAPITFQTSGASYEVTGIRLANQELNFTPGAGNTLLVLTLKTDNASLDDAQNSFFGVNASPATVSQNGGQQYPCVRFGIETDGRSVQVVLVFEVPADWGNTKAFTLSGESFGAVNLNQ